MKRINARRNGHNRTKASALLTSLTVLLCFAVVYSVAFLIAKGVPITNIFRPTVVATKVEETFVNNVKTNVSVQNTGNTDAFIRAAIVVTWKDADGNVYAGQPEKGTHYTMDLNLDDWFLGADGFYYCKTPVKPDEFTPVLINSCSPVEGQTPEGYGLNVEILGSGIQSVPTSVVENAWGVSVTEGELTQGGATQ